MINFEVETLRTIIIEIAEQRNFSKDVDITFSRGSEKGNGYMGEIVGIYVADQKTHEELHLVAKISMKDDKIRQIIPVAESFEREIHAYTKIFPAYQKIQLEYEIGKPFNAVPKCFASNIAQYDEYLILEDLRKSGFEMYNIKELLDHEHTEHIFERYGELHALSFAMKVLRPLEYQKLRDGLKFSFDEFVGKGKVGEFYLSTWKFIRNTMDEKGYQYELLDNYAKNCLVIMKTMTKSGDENFSSILHGDCWMNNLMFNYKEIDNGGKKLNEIKILDWGACHVGSPVFDLSYLIYSTASKGVLNNFKNYLKIYHDSLSNLLCRFGLDANSVYPFNELKRQWKIYCHFGVIMSGPIWKLRSTEEPQVIDHLEDTTNEDTMYLDEIVEAECDKDFLVENMRNICDHIFQVINDKI